MEKRNLPIGIEFYKKIIEEDYYYVDKTLMIKELLDKKNYVSLFTRPRRFGKTLALDMIKTFFEKEWDENGREISNGHYFKGMKIMSAGEKYTSHMGQYPVIFLSLKSAKQPDMDTAAWMLKKQIANEYMRHRYVLASDKLLESEKELYKKIMSLSDENKIYADAIAFLSGCLAKYHGEKTIILIDEYDVPLENAYFSGFYKEMTVFIRSLMESSLKTNENLKFAIITGCLRISKESIFTGLNNLNVISVMSDSFAEYFGFMQSEVLELLSYYELENRMGEVREWYDGYLFGKTEVYNPWSVICYLNSIITDKIAYPRPYWANTSSNSIIKELIEGAGDTVKAELEDLMFWKTISKPVYEDITYENIHSTPDNLWNFLLLTGYLKMTNIYFDGAQAYVTMAIPNREVRYIYETSIMEWFRQCAVTADFSDIYLAMLNGNAVDFETYMKDCLKRCISFYDEKETFYHGFVMGIIGNLKGYRILSNRETGNGRADIILKPLDDRNPAVIFELKYTKDSAKMEAECDNALRQIEERGYMDELLEDGCSNVVKYGICFCKKNCRIRCRKENGHGSI
ncbi:MAG TPA: AAA family ATPase [Lachnospiraceae bacterium]|nr:AAA family ATPase [Lachnospiraceae bacterium]